MATLGSLLRGAGYRSSYIGKWHLSQSEHPDMEAYGFADWDGNDRHFMGWAGTGVHFDPIIASNAARGCAPTPGRSPVPPPPWFLTVALVNPHDVMWFPIDQPGYEAAPSRGRGVGAPHPRRRRVEGRRPSPDLSQGLRRGRRASSPPTSTTTSTPSPRPTASGVGTSSTACGDTSTPATPGPGSATSTTTWSSSVSPTRVSGRCSAPSRTAVRGTTPWSSSPPTTATCAGRTAFAPRAFRLRRDHAGAAVYAGPGRDDRRCRRPGPRHPRRPGGDDLRPGRRGRRRGGNGHAGSGLRASTSRRCWPTRRPRCATTCCSPRTRRRHRT